MKVYQVTAPDEKERISREILEALKDWFEIPETREAYIRESREQPFLAAEHDGRAVGFLCLKETGKATVELAVMGVKAEYHRQGIGRTLFREARRQAVDRNADCGGMRLAEDGHADLFAESTAHFSFSSSRPSMGRSS